MRPSSHQQLRRSRFVLFMGSPLIAVCLLLSAAGCGRGPMESRGDDGMFGSPLTKAIARGMESEGDLRNEIYGLGDYSVKSRRDAKAICGALEKLPDRRLDSHSNVEKFRALTGLFQDVAGAEAPAFGILRSRGLAQLGRVYDELARDSSEESEDALLFALKIMAMYGTPEGTERVIAAARRPLGPDDYMWSIILGMYSEEHPQAARVLAALSDPIPLGFIAVSLLDAANAIALAGRLDQHPFDSSTGRQRLEEWLTDENPDHFSYAHSATAALPFVENGPRSQLLAIAAKHRDVSVRMEASWAAAKTGDEAGIRQLSEICLDPNHSATACQYLEELGHPDAIPAKATSPDFAAMAEFARWLAHPSELGRPPDKLEIIDSRTLAWPPERTKKDLWLIKYTVHDDTGLEDDDVDVGMVGSTTFCLFSSKLAQRPPEDGYAIHCCWELECQELLTEEEIETPDHYAQLLEQWRGERPAAPEIQLLVKISPRLKYPQALVALASATIDGEQGWIVLDGNRSAWYPAAQMPDSSKSTVLKVHIGRQLLGFRDQPEREKYLAKARKKRAPAEIVSAYENILNKAVAGSAFEKRKLVTGHGSPLGRHLSQYAKACAQLGTATEEETIIRVCDQLLDVIAAGDDEFKKDGYNTFGPFGSAFDEYVEALTKAGQREELVTLVNLLGPWWDHNLGYGKLGSAAYKAEEWQTAEAHFVKLRAELKEWERADGIGLLARIWHRQGEHDECEELLLESLRRLLAGAKDATGSDKNLFEEWYQAKRAIYVELFPDAAANRLATKGLPESTVQRR